MPTFQVHYLGKVHLRYKLIEASQSLSPSSPQNPTSFMVPSTTPMNSQTLTLDSFSNLIWFLLKYKDYCSSITIYEKSGFASPILSFNISLACIFTQQYAYALRILALNFKNLPEFVLLKGYLYYMLRKDTKALQLFSQYQQMSAKDTSLSCSLQKVHRCSSSVACLPKKPSMHKMISHTKTNSTSTAITNTSSNPPQHFLQKPTKKLTLLLRPKERSQKGIIFRKRPMGLNIDDVYSETLPDVVTTVITLADSPELPKIQTPSESGYFTITYKSLRKIIKHYTSDEKDLNLIYKIVKKLKFFQLLADSVSLNLLKKAEYVFFPQEDIIFREGDFADCLYIILKGSVSVEQKQYNMKIIVNSRYDGEIIGEYALAKGNIDTSASRRSATCIAGEATHMLAISFSDYIESLTLTNKSEGEMLNFLKTVVPFSHISLIDLSLLSSSLQPQAYGFEQQVLDYGEVPKGMYIVFKGRLKVLYRGRGRGKKVDIELPPKSFFGHSVIVAESRRLTCRVISYAIDTELILVEPHHFDLIYHQVKESTLAKLLKYIAIDL